MKIFLIAGEPSGDLQASLLVKELKAINKNIQFYGLGGQLMRNEGVKIYYDLASEAVVGFAEVIKKINFFRKLFKDIFENIRQENPDFVIFVDYPGFNLRLAKEVKKLGITTIYYISPQIWAWGLKRIKIIKEYIDEVLVFFKFEEEFYKKYSIKVKFVGHPLLDLIKPTVSEQEFIKKYNLNSSTRKIFLMPGSRDNEVRCHLPIILKAIKMLPDIKNLEFLLLKSPYLKKEPFITENIPLVTISHDIYNAISYAYAGVVASGTATLESALLAKPYIIIYKTSLLNYLILKPQIKVPYIGMVNLILKDKAIPEFIQNKCNPRNITREINKLLSDSKYYLNLQNKLLEFRMALGEKGAVRRAAEYILNF